MRRKGQFSLVQITRHILDSNSSQVMNYRNAQDWTNPSLSFTFKSSKLEGRGPGFLLGTLLVCLGELAADVGVLLLFRVFSGEFPLLLCLSFSGLQVTGKRGTRKSMLNILCYYVFSQEAVILNLMSVKIKNKLSFFTNPCLT